MSTHNTGFYEDLTKVLFQLSSNTHLISSSGNSREFHCIYFFNRVGKMPAFMSKIHATGIYWHFPEYSGIFWHFQRTILNRHLFGKIIQNL